MLKHTFKTSDGIEIAYYIDDFTDPWKPAEPLLMLHSAMGSARRFFSMVPGLARRFHVIRADTRGHGASQVPPDTLHLNKERLTEDALELLHHLEIDRAHVIGNSAGGFVAQQLAIHHPQRVRSLVLFSSTPGFKGEQGKGWIKEAAKRGMRPFFAETISDRFPVGEVEQGMIEWFLDEICKNDLNHIARFVGYWSDTDFMGEVHRIKCPTLIVAPGDEPIGHASAYEEMKKRIAGSELIYYEKARHNVCDYLPDRCVSDVMKFHDRHFPAR
ncbi:MAG: alpha/beta hydrolase [Betaproteobacteria bacterium]|nr:alpha/beta hydrolase [Betaproteobacteria bacterium]